MSAMKELRLFLMENPGLTAREVSKAMGWGESETYANLNYLIRHGDAVSMPKRYELTQGGKDRASRKPRSQEERRAARRAWDAAYSRRIRAKKKIEREMEKARIESLDDAAAHDAPKPSGSRVVSRALANRHPLSVAWGK